MPRQIRNFCPQLVIDLLQPCNSSSEPSPVPMIDDRKNGPSPVKEGQGIKRIPSIGERLDMAGADESKSALLTPSSRPPSSRNASAERPPSAQATLRSSGNKVLGLRAAFEQGRGQSRSPQRPTSQSYTPPEKRVTVSGERLAALEAEIARLRNDLSNEQSQRQAVEAKRAELEDTLSKEADLRHAFEEKCTGLEEEVENLKTQLAKQDAAFKHELEKRTQELAREQSDAVRELKSVRTRASVRDSQADGLQRQLTDLKRSISRSTRVETVVTSDSTFRQEMDTISYEVQNWVVNNYRKAKVNPSMGELHLKLKRAVNERRLEKLKPVYARWRSENKLAIFQATVVCLMMDIFEEQLLYGMPTNEDWAVSIRNTAASMSSVLGPAQFNRWRSTTLDSVRNSEPMGPAMDRAAYQLTDDICTVLDEVTEMNRSDAKISSLQTTIKRTITLAHLFRIQRSQFDVKLPTLNDAFDPETMENTAFDSDAQAGSPLDCAIFPAVLKVGDERGENTQWRNVVLKARVICGE